MSVPFSDCSGVFWGVFCVPFLSFAVEPSVGATGFAVPEVAAEACFSLPEPSVFSEGGVSKRSVVVVLAAESVGSLEGLLRG